MKIASPSALLAAALLAAAICATAPAAAESPAKLAAQQILSADDASASPQQILSADDASASPQQILSADDAVAMAIASDEGLKQAGIALEAKRRALGLSWNELLPSIAASAGLSGSGAVSSASSAAIAATGGISASLSITPASLGDAERSAKLALESQLLAYEKAKTSLELSVRKAIFAILLDQEQLKLARQNIARQEASCAQTEAKYKAGLAPELDLLSAQVKLATLKPTADSYETALADELDSLKSLVGAKVEDEVTVTGSLEAEEAAIAALLEKAKAQKETDNRSVAAAAKSLEVARQTASALARSKLSPSIALAAALTPSVSLGSASGASGSLSTSLSASVSLPVDNYLAGSAARESIAQAQDAVSTDESALKAALKATLIARASDERSVKSYQSSLAVLKLNVELAEKTYAASAAAYEKGYTTLTDLQSAAGDLESAKLSALSKSYDLIAAILELEYETGLPLDTLGRL